MSIVLDALRKAEAERARGEVPGLHSGLGPAVVPLPASRTAALPWAWLAAGAGGLLVLIAVVIGAGAWWRWVRADVAQPANGSFAGVSQPSQPSPSTPLPSASVPVPSPATTPAPIAATARVTAGPTPVPAPAPVPTPVTPPAAPAAATSPTKIVPLGQATPAPQANTVPSTITPPIAPITPVAPAVAAPATPPADGRPVALADLPEDVRRELPPLSVGGLIQMDDPPRRSLIINGVIVMEGEAIQPGLVLERIGNGQAVLRHKGWRVLLGI
ncbi:general secretion pathway protein GspB [Leptothrix discophora]|uniref:General secretion pathway protein GspB n=1 Tax=Leptothrix discophora TaxID=89 RepID=A0ABT9FZB3_LEPDI|nr:general secretion pathway protein GspB [Leptothrix discophora]MDP4299298.1 general secretion pathway protein GspB [Leptothrix discophora]